MRSLKYGKYKNKDKKQRKTKGRKQKKPKSRKQRKSKSRKQRKTKGMKGGNQTLSSILNIDLGPAEATLSEYEADVYSTAYSPLQTKSKAPGMNVGQPNNSWYTGFGWFQ